jgi:hypothetical protein
MARALVTSVVVFVAGEAVGFGFGDAVVFGDAVAFGEAVVFGEADGLGLGAGDFLVAAFAKGAQQAKATVQAVMRWSLFFIGWGGCWVRF